MAKVFDEHESGLKFGTSVKLKRSIAVAAEASGGCDAWMRITGDKCAEVSLIFDRAGHNHQDELSAYCFKLPSGEEIWFEFSDTVSTEDRVRRLKCFLDW